VRKNRKTGKVQKPKRLSVAKWFATLDRLNTEPFMKDGRHQPRTPRRKIFS
jgi:hypothetical protein